MNEEDIDLEELSRGEKPAFYEPGVIDYELDGKPEEKRKIDS